MRSTIRYFTLLTLILLFNGCIVKFIPETDEDQELLVVEGLITDQPEANFVKLSKSLPLGVRSTAKPLKGCTVSISDDLSNYFSLRETTPGTYATDPAVFQGSVGRTYILHINTNNAYNGLSFESFPMEMLPVPPIDSIYYEKVTIKEKDELSPAHEGCQIYLNTHDPGNICKFYRWEYSETWEFRLPYDVPNNKCWISSNSDLINVKSTSLLQEDRINKYPLAFISDNTDRLKVKYSILAYQYSLNEDEYSYWEKLRNFSQQVGSLYDITPASVASNIWCVEHPEEKVLGYFSVSAKSMKRIFIKDYFSGIINLYSSCISDTVYGRGNIPGLNIGTWVIEDHLNEMPAYRVMTITKGCADCTVRGTKVEPLFWREGK